LVDTNNPTGYSQPIEQASTPGTPQITYVWGAQLISETYATGATIPGVGTASSPTTYYLVQDAHGSTRLITDANGNVVARYNYDASGNALGFSASTAFTTYLYSSMPFDAASGNYYDHARFYDSGTGSFTQADYGYSGSLANPMSDLSYMLAGGDPINMLDLSGHDFGLASFEISFSIQAQLSSIDVSVGATAQLALQGFMQGQTSSEIITEFFIGQLFGAGLVAAPAFLDSINGAIGGLFRAEAESGAVAGAPLDSLVSLFSSVDITDQMSADAANSRFFAEQVRGQGKNILELVAPYRGGTMVAVGRVKQALTLLRFYNPAADAFQQGGFLTTLDQVRGLTPEQIQDVLSLPYVPTMVTNVEVPVGTDIAIGMTSTVFGNAGDGLQVELLGQIPPGSFVNGQNVSGMFLGQ
ncbi:MAG: RHS repeat domain-containing protein, partial [Phycisphaerae bacterium]